MLMLKNILATDSGYHVYGQKGILTCYERHTNLVKLEQILNDFIVISIYKRNIQVN